MLTFIIPAANFELQLKLCPVFLEINIKRELERGKCTEREERGGWVHISEKQGSW